MSIRSMILALVVGCFAVGCVSEDSSTEDLIGTEVQYSNGSHVHCHQNKALLVICTGDIVNVGDVDVEIKNVGLLTKNKINLLTNFLNNLTVVDIGQIKVAVKSFLALIGIVVLDDDIKVCHKGTTICV